MSTETRALETCISSSQISQEKCINFPRNTESLGLARTRKLQCVFGDSLRSQFWAWTVSSTIIYTPPLFTFHSRLAGSRASKAQLLQSREAFLSGLRRTTISAVFGDIQRRPSHAISFDPNYLTSLRHTQHCST